MQKYVDTAARGIDAENGTVDRAVFSDADIYELEMERIFARAWNFMCHESQIPKPGDFFLNFIGEDGVIASALKASCVGYPAPRIETARRFHERPLLISFGGGSIVGFGAL